MRLVFTQTYFYGNIYLKKINLVNLALQNSLYSIQQSIWKKYCAATKELNSSLHSFELLRSTIHSCYIRKKLGDRDYHNYGKVNTFDYSMYALFTRP